MPFGETVRLPKISDQWFDHGCRSVKRLIRRLGRAYSAAGSRQASDDLAVIAAKTKTDRKSGAQQSRSTLLHRSGYGDQST